MILKKPKMDAERHPGVAAARDSLWLMDFYKALKRDLTCCLLPVSGV